MCQRSLSPVSKCLLSDVSGILVLRRWFPFYGKLNAVAAVGPGDDPDKKNTHLLKKCPLTSHLHAECHCHS